LTCSVFFYPLASHTTLSLQDLSDKEILNEAHWYDIDTGGCLKCTLTGTVCESDDDDDEGQDQLDDEDWEVGSYIRSSVTTLGDIFS
jgi:hypothetical protein